MLDWKALCRSLALHALVPEEFAEYRRALNDAFIYFLDNLSPPRVQSILHEQARLPAEASTETRLVALARSCPSLQKLGQTLARDRRLAPELRVLLQGLESLTPTAAAVRDLGVTIESELGPLDSARLVVEDEPLAEASVAVVVPFTWLDGRSIPSRRGVLKVLKPGIEAILQEELDLLPRVGTFLDECCEHYGIPALDYKELFSQVRDKLGREVCLELEQEHLVAARRAYASMSDVVIPEVFPFCTGRITAMQRVDGRKVTELGGASTHQRRRVARTIAEALIAHPMWSSASSTMFHADPHAGNLLLTDDGKLAILDWSLVGTLTKSAKINVTQALLGAITLNASRIVQAITSLARGPVDTTALNAVVAAALRSLRRGAFPGVEWLTGLMDGAVTRAGVALGSDLLMFRKLLHILEGVTADVARDCDVDAVVSASFATRLGLEWCERLVTPPFSRGLRTHVSNADLFELFLSGPLSAARYWAGLEDLCTSSSAEGGSSDRD